MPQCWSVAGREMFDSLMDTLKKFALPVKSGLVAFSSLNAAAVLGKNNPVLSKLKVMNLNIVNAGCLCHLADFHSKSWGKKHWLKDSYVIFIVISQGQHMIKGILIFAEGSTLKTEHEATSKYENCENALSS